MAKREKDPDAAIWARVAETATPLKKQNRVARDAAPSKPPAPGKANTAAKPPPKAPQPPPRLPSPRTGLEPHTGLDRQTARKLDKGRLALEARLDLHGMRQREAHAALRKFLNWARGKDYRHVLIITGKGSGDEASSFYAEEQRGVLRQAVPRWLAGGDLAPLIVSVSEAPRRLGGEGALYVRLRRPDHPRAR